MKNKKLLEVNRFIDENSLHYKVGMIASHGHTTFHVPHRKMTAQLGDGAAIAAETGLPVVTDLRALDIAFGGQGAPIVPIGEKYLLKDYDMYLNLGGIANISFNHPDKYIAFDICPANRVLNMIIAAEDLVFVFLGEPWLNIVPLFTWFSLTGVIGTINGFNDSFITSQGETGILVRTGMFEKVLTVAALLSALPFGLQGLVIARLITAIVVVIPKTSALLKVAKLSSSHWLRTILPTILICGCVALVGFGSKTLTEDLSPVVRLAYISAAFLILVPVLSIIFRETSFQHLAHVILNRRRSFANKENGL
ncbi:MAG: hypothetical protein EOO01_02575 [Chitinophagaceae bacterium]|nr:MAG: hypothetical protein EOO01_02575 [Chitinophagaceae bacterium]